MVTHDTQIARPSAMTWKPCSKSDLPGTPLFRNAEGGLVRETLASLS